VLEYQAMGFLPAGLLNYLLRLGWSHGDQEIFAVQEMIELFDLANVSQSAARFDPEKLLWVNQQHLMTAPADALAPLVGDQLARQGLDPKNGPPLDLTIEALRERSQTTLEMAERAHCYYEEYEEFDAKSARAHLRPVARDALIALKATFAQLGQWTEASTQEAVESVAAQLGIKMAKVAQPLRVALTGQAASPGIGVTLVLVGRERTAHRIDRALEFIDARIRQE
jgi:glutamyl-tRNA synthetase